jgi:ANTAR domain
VVDRGVAEPERHAAGLPEPSRGEVVIRRTATGWRVEGAFPTLPTDTVDDLGHALVLADLLAEGTVPGPRPPRPADDVDEVTRLQASVRQLEHALASRVVVEQAIGVLSERWSVAPRDAFDRLRRVTRSQGLRIHDLARLVVESSTHPEVGLPPELVPTQRGPDQRGSQQEPDGRGPDGRRPDQRRPVQHVSDRRGPDQPPEPRQSPDPRARGEGRARPSRPADPVPARSNGSHARVPPVPAAAPAPRAAHGRGARVDT